MNTLEVAPLVPQHKFLIETIEIYVVTHIVSAVDAETAVQQVLRITDIANLPHEYHNRGGVRCVLEQVS
jgi:hypothetical protein